jgi:diguanylate cyclase (GGDEF)-like protein
MDAVSAAWGRYVGGYPSSEYRAERSGGCCPGCGGVMNNHRIFTPAHRRRGRGPAGGGHAGLVRGFTPARVPFLVRWALAVSLAMLAAGAMEFGVSQQQLADRTLKDSLRDYQALAQGVEEALVPGAQPVPPSEAVSRELHHLGYSYGTVYVGLFASDGRLISGSRKEAGPGGADVSRLAQVAATGQATVGMETDPGEDGEGGRYEFLLPVSSPEGTLVLEIDQRADTVTEVIADLALRKVLELVLAVLVAIPLSYAFGGRALHQLHLRAQRQASADPLTSLPGRRPFRPALATALTHKTEPTVTLALIDLDGFKQFNDRLGHSYGDRVLTGLADSFSELGASDTPFRLGGDEFAVIFPGSEEDRSAEALERVRTTLTGRFPSVTFSAGIASSMREAPAPLQELWERADAALYEAKRRGRRQTVTFGSMAAGHTVSAVKIQALTELLQDNTPFAVAFQPIWDLRGGVVLAHEALLRLPKGSPIAGPQEAFDLAERLGLAAELDARAREAVITAVTGRKWEGLLFLNIHPDALADLNIDSLTAGLGAAGLEPRDVVLEVTEQAGLDHPEPIRSLARAHEKGFRLALDDMGSSNAGLRALTLVRFDIIKVDREVISRFGTDTSSAATVAAAMTFIGQTGGWVVAEGIEDQQTLTALMQPEGGVGLRREPVLAGQGYLLGRPNEQPISLDSRLPILERHLQHEHTDGHGGDRISSETT